MIRIGKPFIERDRDKAYLKAPIDITADTAAGYTSGIKSLPNCFWLVDDDYPPKNWDSGGTMWFSVEEKYARYLCDSRSDAFVVALLWYALITGSDISFEAPVSKRLYKGITEVLMPELEKAGTPAISLLGPLSSEPVRCEGGTGTGMTGGVDSVYTAFLYGGDDEKKEIELTHLTLYMGSNLYPFLEGPYKAEEIIARARQDYPHFIGAARAFADHFRLPLIISYSNMDTDYYRGGLPFMTMYRNAAHSLALQHLFGRYVSSSSGYADHDMEVSIYVPTQHYEDLICQSLQTEGFSYTTSDHTLRTEKIRAIADDICFQEHAEVCYAPYLKEKNCGRCFGCWKTMIPLDILGKLEAYDKCFFLEDYYKNRREVFREMILFSRRPEASFAREILRQMLELAREEKSSAGKEFMEVYDALSGKNSI